MSNGAKTRDTVPLSQIVARGAGVSGLSGVVVQLVLLVTYVGLARLAPPEVFGTFAAASILVTLGALFVESGMSAALIHRADRVDEAAATALVSTLLGGVALTALSAALAPLVGLIFESDDITPIALSVAGLHLVNAAGVVPTALLQRELAYRRRAVVDPLWMATYGGTAAAGLAVGLEAWALVIATYASAMLRTTLVWALIGRAVSPRKASFEMWRQLASYARHVLASEFLRHTGTVVNTAGVGRFLGTHDLGQYNFGSQLVTQASVPLTTGSAFVLFPVLARLSSTPERLAGAFGRALTSVLFVAAPLSLAFLPFGKPLVILLLGAEWAAAGDVVTSLCLVGVALVVMSISSEAFKATGRPDLLPRMHALSALVPIAAVGIGVAFGIVVIAACISVGLMLVAGAGLWAALGVTGTPRAAAARILAATLGNSVVVASLFLVVERAVVDAASHGTALGFLILAGESLLAGIAYVVGMRVTAPAMTTEFLTTLRHLRGTTRPPA